INKYVKHAAEESDAVPRAAVLYRTNFQSRLFEEALRRYGLKYHVVGGFSFYERAEIKDMISYLKVLQNPDDSVALLRVINTPVRGIGKTTLDTLERLALETGSSMWTAVERAISQTLLPPRACAALQSFREIILDGRAMMGGTFRERLEETAGLNSATEQLEGSASAFDVAADDSTPATDDETNLAFEFSDADSSFDFGALEDESHALEPSAPDESAVETGLASSPASAAAKSNDQQPTTNNRAASTAELLKLLLDRTGYIKALEAEDTPEASARIENLKELVNAAMDSRDRGETLAEFL